MQTALWSLILKACVLFCVLCFAFNNQTIVYICALARSHEEEHPNKEERSQTGKWAGWKREEKSGTVLCLWSLWIKVLKVHCGEKGGEGKVLKDYQ